MKPPIEMQPPEAIQAAHDRLVAILLHEVTHQFSREQVLGMNAAAATLCWVLKHEHNTAFADMLRVIDQQMVFQGLELRDEDGRPAPPLQER